MALVIRTYRIKCRRIGWPKHKLTGYNPAFKPIQTAIGVKPIPPKLSSKPWLNFHHRNEQWISSRSYYISKRRDNEGLQLSKKPSNEGVLGHNYFLCNLPAIAEGKDQKILRTANTYNEYIQKASDINDKWIEYKADFNKCRDKSGISGEYWALPTY